MTPPKETNKALPAAAKEMKAYKLFNKEFRIILSRKFSNYKKTQTIK